MKGTLFNVRINDIDCKEDDSIIQDKNLNEMYGLFDMIQIKTVFENLVNELKDKIIYKVIFKFQGTVMNAEGSMSSNIKSTVPIFIIKGVQVESLLTKMTMAGIMMKEWIISNEFEGFNNMVTSLVKNEQIFLNKFGVESAQDKDLVKFNIKKEDIYKNLKKFNVWKGVSRK
uniref:DNA polymerase n=1 Tax=Armillaria solidipes TaxID=1076256 RepID=A0A4D6FF67_9AGAR|nr:DNA polymerase [Armillaria solidipes]QCB16454.1 DNA polymerase [Armillaria solidipes]